MPITSVNRSERGQAEEVGDINDCLMAADERLFSVDDHLRCRFCPSLLYISACVRESSINMNCGISVFKKLWLDKKSSDV